MKICYLSDAGSAHTRKWCSYFIKLGYEIHVISLNDGEIPGVKVHSLGIKVNNSGDKLLGKINYLFYANKVKKLVKEISPDILHAHYATSYGYLGGKCNFHPYIISVWGSDVYDFPKRNSICKAFVKSNLSKADVILSTSKAMAEETNKYTDKIIEITPFGVDINMFKPKENKYEAREKIIIGTVKTLEPLYGIDYLIKAFAALAHKYNNIFLEIAGPGSQRKVLEELCNALGVDNRVKFLGFINQNQVVEAFNRFDIAVFPSLHESFGVAAVEAQACGTAAIVSNVGGLPEATCPDKSSIVVSSMNVEELANAMEKLILDEDLRISMGKYGRRFVIENYNVKDNFNKVDNIYKNILTEFK